MWRAWIQSVACLVIATACGRPDQQAPKACATDAECGTGTVCRVARCRKACEANHWVGQPVQVSGLQGKRAATISACDAVVAAPAASSSSTLVAAVSSGPPPPRSPRRLWVRYESGMEEQVEVKRVTAEGTAPAKPVGP
jgi:hypothetical protein